MATIKKFWYLEHAAALKFATEYGQPYTLHRHIDRDGRDGWMLTIHEEGAA